MNKKIASLTLALILIASGCTAITPTVTRTTTCNEDGKYCLTVVDDGSPTRTPMPPGMYLSDPEDIPASVGPAPWILGTGYWSSNGDGSFHRDIFSASAYASNPATRLIPIAGSPGLCYQADPNNQDAIDLPAGYDLLYIPDLWPAKQSMFGPTEFSWFVVQADGSVPSMYDGQPGFASVGDAYAWYFSTWCRPDSIFVYTAPYATQYGGQPATIVEFLHAPLKSGQ